MNIHWSEQEIELNGFLFTGLKNRRDAVKKYCNRRGDVNDESKPTLLGYHFTNHPGNTANDCDFLIRKSVEFINNLGIITISSCQGTSIVKPYIIFAPNTLEQINNITQNINKIFDPYTTQTFEKPVVISGDYAPRFNLVWYDIFSLMYFNELIGFSIEDQIKQLKEMHLQYVKEIVSPEADEIRSLIKNTVFKNNS
jgi:hypothetical protein